MDEQHLVLVMMNDLRQRRPATDQIGGGELTLEDGILQVIAKAAHGLEDLAESLVVADVVTNQVRLAHSTTLAERSGISWPTETPIRGFVLYPKGGNLGFALPY